MANVLTVIGAAGGLSDDIVVRALGTLNHLGAVTAPPDWLSPAEACDVAFQGLPEKDAEKAVRSALKGAPVDYYCGPSEGRRKRLLVADMDSTIITSETLDELAALAGKGDEITAITTRSMLGEIDFHDALRRRLAILKGMPETLIAETLAGVQLTPGAATLVRTMAAAGAHTALVSGGFTPFTEAVATMAGFHDNFANHFDFKDGQFSGNAVEPILGPEAKLETLMRLAGARNIPITETLAIGDGANDVPMLQAAGLGIAHRGKPVAVAAADARIDHTELTAALFMQGYRRAEFVS
ncbi:MAG: phosphoserine phosphatase SerB [Proteobacteria bacterium]|nr:phosphoserine phosphatase SerB [Pseudomonadota bacterium]